jgi:ABC-type uncharacterized transport system substrate-binding protein
MTCQRILPLSIYRVAASLVLSLCMCYQPASAGTPNILLVASADTVIYQRFQAAFRTQWTQPGGATLPPTIYLDNDRLDSSVIQAGTDLIVTIGSKAARTIAGMTLDIPVLNTVIPESVYRSLPTADVDCRRQTAIFIDQPIRRQYMLASLMFPQLDNMGILLGPVSAGRLAEINKLQSDVLQQLTVMEVAKNDSTMIVGRDLIATADLFIAINDPVILSRENAKWLLYVAYQKQVPVIGFSKTYVKAGAAAAVFSEPEQIARQSAELARHWGSSPGRCLPSPSHAKYFNVTINHAVSQSLGSSLRNEDELVRLIMEQEKP